MGFFGCTRTRPVEGRGAREPRRKITNKEIGKNLKAQIIIEQHFPGNLLAFKWMPRSNKPRNFANPKIKLVNLKITPTKYKKKKKN